MLLTDHTDRKRETKLNFKHFPKYARFLADHHLEKLVRFQFKIAKQIKVPLLRFFESYTDEQVIQMSIPATRQFLHYIIENRAEDQIDFSIKQWIENQLPQITRDQVVAEDITLVSYMRKQALLEFLSLYTSDVNEVIEIIKEVDQFITESETRLTNIFINLLKESIEAEAYFKNRITDTSPGITFVYDFTLAKHVYVKDKIQQLFGYSLEDLAKIEGNIYEKIVHPDDQLGFRNRFNEFLLLKDGEIRYFEYRILHKNGGGYRWVRNYESIFKRNEQDIPTQIIGISIDITEEKMIASELVESRQQLLEAQELSEIGSYEWDLISDRSEYTPQIAKIFDLYPGSKFIDFMEAVHPADRLKVEASLHEAFSNTGKYDCEYRYHTRDKEKILWSRGVVEFYDGKAVKLKGTVMDVTERHHMIQRLERSEALYKQAQALSHMGNWTWDIDAGHITWSDELFRIFGLEPQATEMNFQKFLSFVHPDDRQKFQDELHENIRTLNAYEYDFRIILTDGTVKMLSGKLEVLKDPQGNAFKLIGACQDVTRQKQVEKELLDNQNFIRKIADATPSVITSYNIHTGKFLFINQAFEKMLGYKREMVMEKGAGSLTELVHPDDLQPLMEKNAKAIELANQADVDADNEMVVEFKYRMRHANGEYRWLQTYVTIFDRDANNQVEHMLNISADITEMVEVEKKIEEQEHFIKHIADASPTVLYLFDAKSGSIIYVNREIENVLGYTPEEITQMGSNLIAEIFHPEDALQLPLRLQQYNLGDQSKNLFQFECRLKNKNGEWCWFLVREIVFRRNANGKISEVLGAALDISLRKEMEDTLFHQTIALKHSNTSLGEFAYVASHDLKEPLRKISTFGDRLISFHSASLDPDAKNYLDKIIDSSKRMQQLIDDLLSISIISSERNFETYSLKKIVVEVMHTLEFKIEEKKAVITHSELPDATIVPAQFRQLFQNLLSNSLKFSKKDQAPVIQITHNFLRPYEVPHSNLAKANIYLEIRFTDNGIGFDRIFSEKIFTIFQRLHNRSQFEGTGIGLAICKRIVENHGGVIYGTGMPGDGAAFTIIIPFGT